MAEKIGKLDRPLMIRWINTDKEYRYQYRFFCDVFTNPNDKPSLRTVKWVNQNARNLGYALQKELLPADLFVILNAYSADGNLVGCLSSEVDVNQVNDAITTPRLFSFLRPLILQSRVLNRVAVHPDWRGQGVAASLIAACEVIHVRQGIRWWYGIASNAGAERFFRSLEFVVHNMKDPEGLPTTTAWSNFWIPFDLGEETTQSKGFHKALSPAETDHLQPPWQPGISAQVNEYKVRQRGRIPWNKWGYL